MPRPRLTLMSAALGVNSNIPRSLTPGARQHRRIPLANGNRDLPDRVRVEIPDAWYHVTNNGGFHDAHCHGDCSWCGIYYLQAGDNAPAHPSGTNSGAGNGITRFYAPIGTGALVNDFGN